MKLRACLAAIFAISVVISPVLAQEEANFVGQQQCKMCHNKKAEGEQWNVWKSTAHAKAVETLKTDEAKAVAERIGLDQAPHEAADCLQCHVTAYDPETKSAPPAIKLADSVQCETCHGPGSLHLDDGKKVMFQKDDSIDISAHIKKGSEETCRECHNEKNPTWKTDRYTLESGEKVGFDFKQAYAKIAHPNPTKQDE